MTCPHCKTVFAGKTARAIYCSPACRRAAQDTGRKVQRKERISRFIGIDGEGINIPGSDDQMYALLSCGDQSLYHGDKRLTWREIFPFLYAQFEANQDAVFVGFSLAYDFNQWIRTLTQHEASMLLTIKGKAARQRTGSGGNPIPFPVYIGPDADHPEWEIDTLGLKRFKLRPGVQKGVKNEYPWMVICDVFAFFQMSFLKVLTEWGGELPAELLSIVTEGKGARATTQYTVTPEMIEYNKTENLLLAHVMTVIDEAFKSVGIRLGKKQWFGPGQAAEQWLGMQPGLATSANVENLYGNTCPIPLPRNPDNGETFEHVRHSHYALDIARATYYGGWFEILYHGHIPGPTYEYDINSAYPAIIAELPCLDHLSWDGYQITGATMTKGPDGKYFHDSLPITDPDAPWRIIHVTAHAPTTAPTGPLPHRCQNGNSDRPDMVTGWYWSHEVQAAMNAGLISDIDVDAYVNMRVTCTCPPPLAGMRELYLTRLNVGKNTARGKAMKLIYNSAYGKFAQSVGNPTYANPIYASLITAGTRTMILNAIATHPSGLNDLAMVATDGVYFRTPHPTLDISPGELGKWDEAVKQNMCLLMPGVYWDDKARTGKLSFKSRGVSARALKEFISDLDAQWTAFDGHNWPTVDVHIPFTYISCLLALQATDPEKLSRKWRDDAGRITTSHRIINSTPAAKRAVVEVGG